MPDDRRRWVLRAVGLGGALWLLPGCPNPNLYTTPRTLPPGQLQWNVSAEAFNASVGVPTATVNPTTGQTTTTYNQESITVPMAPSFGIRYGIADGFDFGVHAQNFDSLQADLKIRLLKGSFDLAVDPGFQGYYFSIGASSGGSSASTSLTVVYAHVPLLAAYNFSKSFSLVGSAGFVYAFSSASVTDGSSSTNAVQGASGAMARFGLGLDIRAGTHFAIHPEVTFLKDFQSDNLLFTVFGIGFNFGAMPDYSDLEGGGGGGNSPPPPNSPPPAQ